MPRSHFRHRCGHSLRRRRRGPILIGLSIAPPYGEAPVERSRASTNPSPWSPTSQVLGAEAAVDGVHRARHHGAVRARDIGCEFGYLVAADMALDGHEAVHLVGHRAMGWVHVGVDRPRLDRVYGDASRPEVARESAYHALHR